MKLILALLFLMIFQLGISQTNDTIPEPEFPAKPYYLENDNLKNFERIEVTMEMKIKGFGFGGGESFYTAFEPKSKIRFNKDSLPRIFIKFSKNIDVNENLTILKEDDSMKKKRKYRNKRLFKQESVSTGGKARKIENKKVEFIVQRLRNNIFEIIFTNPLEPGEYAFMPIYDNTDDIFSSAQAGFKLTCFGID